MQPVSLSRQVGGITRRGFSVIVILEPFVISFATNCNRHALLNLVKQKVCKFFFSGHLTVPLFAYEELSLTSVN